jgi:uncharacterized protein (DUF111 family)
MVNPFYEEGILGVRILDLPRLGSYMSRQVMRIIVRGEAFEVSVKTSTVNGILLARKPKYKDLKKLLNN